MYRPALQPRDRAVTVVLVVAIHAALGFALLHAGGQLDSVEEDITQIFDVAIPPPPPIVEQLPEPEQAKPKREEGAASAKNIESKATPVVAPKPRVVVPATPPVVASPTPNQGAAPTQGASDVGPGTGAGGAGTGIGSGGSGSGSGGGGFGNGFGPRLASRTLTGRDYPRDLRRIWPSGARVLVAVRVQLDGRGTNCKVNQSSGIAAIDAETCRLVETRLRFRPAVNGRGEPYVAWYGYMQFPVNF